MWNKAVETSNVAGGKPPLEWKSHDAVVRCIAFRRFRLFADARCLLLDGHEVELGSRAFDLLVVLLESRGRVVRKADIFAHVWPSMTVEESNLRFQMAVLRRVLGPDRDLIKTIPGRGYLFAAEREDAGSLTGKASAAGRSHLPGAGDSSESEPVSTDASYQEMMALELENQRLRRALADIALDRVVVILPSGLDGGRLLEITAHLGGEAIDHPAMFLPSPQPGPQTRGI